MEYVLMLQRAWQIFTRHKLIWLFGLLAMLAGQDALFNLRAAGRLQPPAESILNMPLPAADLARALAGQSDLLLIGLMITIGFVLLFIGVLASAAMIGLTQAAERGDPIDIKVGLRAGLLHIDRLIIIRLIFNVPFVILSLAGFLTMRQVVDPTALGYQSALIALQDIGLLPIFLLIGLFMGVFIGGVGVGADRAVVIDGMDVRAALRQGWETLRDHIGKYVAITGIFVSTLLLATFVLACPVIILFSDQFDKLTGNAALTTDITGTLLQQPVGIVVVIVGVILYAGLTAFASIVWTIAYRRYAR